MKWRQNCPIGDKQFKITPNYLSSVQYFQARKRGPLLMQLNYTLNELPTVQPHGKRAVFLVFLSYPQSWGNKAALKYDSYDMLRFRVPD